MKSKFTLFTFCICYSSLIFAEQITTKFESDKIQKIEIQSTAGKVQIVSTNKKESTLIVDKVKISEKCLITTELKNELLFAKAESSNNSPCEVNFLISAPFHANLDITVGSADIEIENMSGEIDYKSGSGDVVIKNSGNEIEGKSGSGNVIISGVVEEADITTGSGDINIEYAQQPQKGELNIKTGSGDIIVGLPEDSSVETNLKTGSGSIHNEIGESENANLKVYVKSGSGNIKIKRVTTK